MLAIGALLLLALSWGPGGCKSKGTSTKGPEQAVPATEAYWESLFAGDEASLKEFKEAQGDFRSSRHADAYRRLQDLEKRAKGKRWAEAVDFHLALAQRMANDERGALSRFQRFEEMYPSSPALPKALMHQGEILLTMGMGRQSSGLMDSLSKLYLGQARDIFQRVATQYAGDPEAGGTALYRLGTVYAAMGNFDSAKESFHRVVAEYAGTPLAAKALYAEAGVLLREADIEGAERAYGEITDKYPHTRLADRARGKLAGIGLVGYPAPKLQIAEWIGDPPEDVGAYKAKLTVLSFWAIWCPHCRRNLPHMDRLVQDFGPKGVEVVGVTRERKGYEADKIRAFIEQHPIRYATGVDDGGKTSMAFSVTNVPVTVVVDRQGKVCWHGHPDYLTDRTIEALLERSS